MIRSDPAANDEFRSGPRRLARVGGMIGLAACLVAGAAQAEDVGDLVLFQPQTPARASEVNQNFDDVKQAVNSKTTVGFDFVSSDSALPVAATSATPTVALAVTLTAPGPGFIEVDFSAYLTIGHAQGANSYAVCALKTDSTSPEASPGRLPGSRRFVVVLSANGTATYYPHIDTKGVLPVATAGSYTINAVCYRNSNASSSALIYRTLTATYHSDRF